MACLYFTNRHTALETWVVFHLMHSLGYSTYLLLVLPKEMKRGRGRETCTHLLCVCVCVCRWPLPNKQPEFSNS